MTLSLLAKYTTSYVHQRLEQFTPTYLIVLLHISLAVHFVIKTAKQHFLSASQDCTEDIIPTFKFLVSETSVPAKILFVS